MLLKSLTAGVILAGLAGGAVYYGMGEDTLSPVIDTPAPERSEYVDATKDVELEADASDPSSKRMLDAMMGRKTKAAPKRDVGAVADQDEMDMELDVDPDETGGSVEVAKGQHDDDAEPDKPKKRWLDEYLKTDKDSDADSIEQVVELEIGQEADAPDGADTESKTDPLNRTSKDEQVTETIEEAIADDGTVLVKTTTTKRIKDSQGRLTIIKAVDVAPAPQSKSPATKSISVMKPSATNTFEVKTEGTVDNFRVSVIPRANSKIFDLLMRESAKLEIPDMRDQAYMNIVDFAVAKQDKTSAMAAMSKLSREELRDKARGHMAVALAKSGQSEAAFKMLGELEIDELQDPIRLKIIEALTSGKTASK